MKTYLTHKLRRYFWISIGSAIIPGFFYVSYLKKINDPLDTLSLQSKTQLWNAEIKFSDEHSLKFQVETVKSDTSSYFNDIIIVNGDERLFLKHHKQVGDLGKSIWQFPFQSELHLDNSKELKGYFINIETKESYPFTSSLAIISKENKLEKVNRFPANEFKKKSNKNIFPFAKRFAIKLRSNSESSKSAIGEFINKPNSNEYYGSILTETGDYRYLAGNRYGNKLFLSTFDGVHAYTFFIDIKENGSITGRHFSGAGYSEPFIGISDSVSKLRNPYEITLGKENSKVDLKLPEYKTGEIMHLITGRGNVTLIQVMGSWCPNCLDESAFFKELTVYNDLDIYALAFEKSSDREECISAIKKVVDYLDLNYPILFAGKAESGAVEDILPIKNFISYPTYLLYDRKGKLIEVHAGFSGPATQGYNDFTEKLRSKIQDLLD
jgi:thiol-disulfide isomerase/thioredoxin